MNSLSLSLFREIAGTKEGGVEFHGVEAVNKGEGERRKRKKSRRKKGSCSTYYKNVKK